MNPIKEYKIKDKQIKQSFIITGIFLIAGVFLALQTGILMILSLGGLHLIIAILNTRLKIIQIFPNHFEIQKGIIASKKLIKYDQLTGFTRSKKTLQFNYSPTEEDKKTTKLNTIIFTEEDIQEISTILKEKTNLGIENHFNPVD